MIDVDELKVKFLERWRSESPRIAGFDGPGFMRTPVGMEGRDEGMLEFRIVSVSQIDLKCDEMDITITEVGLTNLKTFDEKVSSFHQPMVHKLTSEELKTLRLLIQKLMNRDED